MVNKWFNRGLGMAAWATIAFIAYATLVPLDMRPTLRWISPNAERFAAYGAAAGLLTLAYPRHWVRVALFAVALAGGLELLQLAAPHRHARLADALVKMAGALLGIAIAHFCNKAQTGASPAGN